MLQTLAKVFQAALIAAISVIITRLTESWPRAGLPVELTALTVSLFLYGGTVAMTRPAQRSSEQADPLEALELFEKRWQVYFRTVFARIGAALILAFIAIFVAGLLYKAWQWFF